MNFDRAVGIADPQHYRVGTSGVECIVVVRDLSFDLGNAVKYLWRCGHKDAPANEIRKAHWYFQDELTRLRADGPWVLPADLKAWSHAFTTHIQSVEDGLLASALAHVVMAVSEKNTGSLEVASRITLKMVERAEESASQPV